MEVYDLLRHIEEARFSDAVKFFHNDAEVVLVHVNASREHNMLGIWTQDKPEEGKSNG